jgi:nucleotide-binding universal stress UspA family protein
MNAAKSPLTMDAAEGTVGDRRRGAGRTLRVLLATDGADEAAAACRFLRYLSLPPGSAIRLVSVMAEPPVSGLGVSWETLDEAIEHERSGALEAIGEAEAILACEDLPVTTRVREGPPVKEILLEAEAFDADLVVVGSKGLTGLQGFLHGSVARAIAERGTRAVLVARAPHNGLREVIVATDGSVHASHAVEFAARLPLPDDASSTLIHVVRPHRSIQEESEAGERLLADMAARLSASGRPVRTQLCIGNPATEILALAEQRQANLIVAGARGVSLVEGLLVGSVAEHLLKEAHCSVLIVH